jgi:hypothetical protein
MLKTERERKTGRDRDRGGEPRAESGEPKDTSWENESSEKAG